MGFNEIHNNFSPYGLKKNLKKQIFENHFNQLIQYHYKKSKHYKKILNLFSYNIKNNHNLSEMPFLPVRLFKEYDLLSTPKKNVKKTLLSSGTSGGQPSRIFLDNITALNQIKALNKILISFIGKNKMPMLVIDSPSILKDRNLFSARGAAITGFSLFASKITYALNEDMSINEDVIKKFISKNQNHNFLIFGFTYILWNNFFSNIKILKKFNFKNSIVFHGGGWKKLASNKINENQFKHSLKEEYEIKKIHNYYGMVEQAGSIFVECEYGNMVTSAYSDIIIRDKNFNICDFNKKGIIQLFSIIPESYPGHIILTEDEGMILNEDGCKCGRLGKHFKIFGRIKNAEIRGCSDAYSN